MWTAATIRLAARSIGACRSSWKNRRRRSWSQRRFRLLVGNFLRLVFAILRSSFLLIDWYISFEAPLRDDLERFPRLAASAAPAAICCFFDFAGIPIFR